MYQQPLVLDRLQARQNIKLYSCQSVFNAVSATSFETIKNLFDQWQLQIDALRKAGNTIAADQIESKMLLMLSGFTQNITDATDDTKQQLMALSVGTSAEEPEQSDEEF
jgi:poly-beta-hydroxyalkanoate depolymerase